jgi:fructokinase
VFDVIALGELLIDFVPLTIGSLENPIYEAFPGGAPGNVLAMLSKMGMKTSLITKVGYDFFGRYLIKAVRECGIDVSNISVSNESPTTLAFISNDASGEREFTFYRHFGADTRLDINDVGKFDFSTTRLFHFGTLSMTDDLAESATKYAIQQAKKNHCLISFDPNIRPLLWKTISKAIQAMRYGCSVCDILKLEKRELELLTNENDIDEAVKILRQEFSIPLIFVTVGKAGSYAFFEGCKVFSEGFVTDQTIDTTGAGDAFFGYCLAEVLTKNNFHFNKRDMMEMLKMANAAASFVTTKKGALTIMPSLDEVQKYLDQFNLNK